MNGDHQNEAFIRIIRLTQFRQFTVLIVAHFGWQKIGPSIKRWLRTVGVYCGSSSRRQRRDEELFGQLRSVKVELDAAPAMSEEAFSRHSRSEQQNLLILNDGRQNSTAEVADARIQTLLTMLLPMLTTTFARTVHVITVVTHFVSTLRFCWLCSFTTLGILALHNQLHR